MNKYTFVTAAINVSSDIGRAVLFENDIDIIMVGVCGSRVACSDIDKAVSLTRMVFEEGVESAGSADSNAHSSSSVAGSGAGAGAGAGAGS